MSGNWIKALEKQDLDVKSARDALQVKGWLDSGNYALNWAVSGRLLRGYPLGHCGEIFGDPGTGKSYLATRALAMAQAGGGVALLDDTEGAYVEERAAKIGVDTKALAMVDPRSRVVDDHLKTTRAFCAAFKESKQKLGILVLDSLALLSTKHEMEVGLDKRDMTKAAEMKAFYRIVGGDLFDLPVVHLATNHTIANIGNPFQQRTTGGGGGSKFAASWRLDMRTTSKIKQGDEAIGVICVAVVDKNRFVAPWKKVQLAIPFNQPISRASGMLPLLVSLGVVEQRGEFLWYAGERLGRSYQKNKAKFLELDEMGEQLLDKHPEILEETDAALESGKGPVFVGQHTTEEEAEEESDA